MGLFERLGRNAAAVAGSCCESCALVGETLSEAAGMLLRPRRFRAGDMALAFQRAAFDGLPVTVGVGFLLGVILAFQTASVLQACIFACELGRNQIELGNGGFRRYVESPLQDSCKGLFCGLKHS